MKKLLLLGACLVALASQPVMAQTGGADVVIVKVHEVAGTLRIAISHGEGKTEVIEAVGGASKTGIVTSSESLHKVIAGLYQQGYSLKSTFDGNQGVLSTLVFVKGQ
jgi:threonine dehydrogenase-like Zn-dependent dehydrogenase